MSTNSALSKYKFLGLFPLVMAQIGTSGDNSVLTVATASLLASLNATMSDIQLANIIYSLCAGCLMIVGGMVGLIVGWKKTFRIGAAMCAVGELVVAFSGNIFMFTWGGRLLVGIGASFLIPSVLGLIPGLYQGNDRAFAFGAIGAATGIASCLGPIAAGFLIDTFDWRIAFSCMAVYFTIVFLGSLLVGDVPLPEQKVRFDLKGTVVAVAGLFLLIIGISKIPVWGLIDPIAPPVIGGSPLVLFGMSPALFIALLGLITLVLLVRIERNVEKTYGSCLIPSSFLTTPQVRSGLYLTAMLFLCFGGSFFLVITYLQLVAGFSAIMTGIAMSAMAIPMIVFSMGIPKFSPDASPKKICRTGIAMIALSTIPMALSLNPYGVNWLMYVGLFFFGAGQGFVASQSSNIIAGAVNARDAQQSSGIQTATRNVGQAIGVAILGVVMLFSITGTFKDAALSSADLSSTSKTVISEQASIGFMPDAAFAKYIADKAANADDAAVLTAINPTVCPRCACLRRKSIEALFFTQQMFCDRFKHRRTFDKGHRAEGGGTFFNGKLAGSRHIKTFTGHFP